ncbi:MAG: thiamine-monophosphate kinase, partial [Alistipes sp.]|nr:thiamine-monophosphate kinase [Candidatus Minthomonas equi]
MELSEIGEFGLIERIRKAFAPDCFKKDGIRGIGDDCAVIPTGNTDSLISTDMLLEGTHFIRDRITPYDLGWKSLAVNLSDIAAMGGHPTGTFLSLGLPENISSEYMDEFIRGYRDLSLKWSVPLLGGDTTRST